MRAPEPVVGKSKLTGRKDDGRKSAKSEPAAEISAGAPEFPFLSPPVEADEIGRLANYRVLRLLGSGGMGHVFRAEDVALRRAVALKVMKPDASADASSWKRFLREARVMAQIKHESLVTVYQAGQERDTVYLAMELLDGSSLQDWISNNPRPKFSEILRLAWEIAKGLSIIHRHGLIHRDIKPSNIWLESPNNRVRILDFGLARYITDDQSLTQSGTVIGTPSYMSPEQARGEPVDPRTDLFSFGCVLYYLCTGVDAFQGNNTTAVLTAIAIQKPRPVRQLNPAIPAVFSDLVMRLLEKSPHDRPASIDVVGEQLRSFAGGAKPAEKTIDKAPAKPVENTRETETIASPKPERPRAKVSKKRKRANRWIWPLIGAGTGLGVVICVTAAVLIAKALNRDATPNRRDNAVSSQQQNDPAPPVQRNDPPSRPATPDRAETFVSDLQPTNKKNWPFLPPAPPGMPPMQAIGGVRVRGRDSRHGILMHPPPPFEGGASVSYELAKKYSTFHAEAAFNDGPIRPSSACTFSVYGDGKLLWQSRPLRSQSDMETCDISVKGVESLRLEVTCSDMPDGDFAVWFEPLLKK